MMSESEQLQPAAATPASAPVALARAVCLLGIGQIISWGTLYYSLTVLALPIRKELGFSELLVFGAFSAGLLLSGILAPWVGRRIDSHGGRGVMALGSVGAAVALATVAISREPIVFTMGWLLAGAMNATTLYEPAFASLYQMSPEKYRRSVTGLTLFGGFASTVFWPLSNLLASQWGWREALLSFAALHLIVCLPIHRFVLPSTGMPADHKVAISGVKTTDYLKDPRFYWLAASFAVATLIFSALSSFMVPALGTRGFTVDEAVLIGAMIGPMQVLARVVEWLIAGRLPAVKVGIAACVLYVISMTLLNVMPHAVVPGAVFAICYGAANGIVTIVRGTVPPELFGPQRQGALLGALARPSFLTKALAPAAFAGALSLGVPLHVGMASLAVAAAAGFIFFLFATRRRTVESAP
jgi:predicted MFS family arabinose efflux permease